VKATIKHIPDFTLLPFEDEKDKVLPPKTKFQMII